MWFAEILRHIENTEKFCDLKTATERRSVIRLKIFGLSNVRRYKNSIHPKQAHFIHVIISAIVRVHERKCD